jgi:hypothetical protein
MRLIPLLLGAAAVAAAARFATTRGRSGPDELRPAPPTPPPAQPATPAREPVMTAPGPAASEEPPQRPATDEPAPPAASEEPSSTPPAASEESSSGTRSAVSPATETVRASSSGQVDPVRAANDATPDDSEVEREVEAQLAASPVAADAEITVEVRDRIASLEGSVPDPQTAQAIADEAAHVDGVQGLDNRLRAEHDEAAAGADADDARDPAGGESEKL